MKKGEQTFQICRALKQLISTWEQSSELDRKHWAQKIMPPFKQTKITAWGDNDIYASELLFSTICPYPL